MNIHLDEAHFLPLAIGQVRDVAVGDLLRDVAVAHPDRPALVEGVASNGRRWTYAELLAESEGVGRALAARFAPGERIAVWAPNLPEWVLVEFGAALAGLTLVTVNPAYTASELDYVLRQSRSAGLLLAGAHPGSPMADAAESVRSQLPELREVLDLEAFVADAPGPPGASVAVEWPDVTPMDPAQIQYTSGTTGFPKGAHLHHRGLVTNATFTSERFGTTAEDVWINFMPLFHTAGCGIATLGIAQAGACQVLVPRFDPAAILDRIEQEACTLLLGVPTMLVALLEEQARRPRDLSRIRRVMSGGAMVAPDLVARVEREFGAEFQIVYGQTEVHPVLTQTASEDGFEDKCRTVGRPLPHTEVAVLDPNTGAVCATDEVGEICGRGYCVMLGYFENPEATQTAIDSEGWLHTGDLGAMDTRGYLRVTGRVKEMIIRGGENLFPVEIENVLFEHPAVAEAAVVGVADDRMGEETVAFVRLVEGRRCDREALVTHCRKTLSHQKTPRIWVFVQEFPLTASGKIRKFVLRERFQAGEFSAER